MQGQAEGPRLPKECAVELRRNRVEARLDASRCSLSLQRSVERNLHVILIEDILRPELDAPCTVGSLDSDATIEHRKGVLGLLDVEVGAGIELAHVTAVEIDEAAEHFGYSRRPRDR